VTAARRRPLTRAMDTAIHEKIEPLASLLDLTVRLP
jgi:hypothetical protein